MLTKEILLSKCRDLSDMVLDLSDVNPESDTDLLELDGAINCVNDVDGTTKVQVLSEILKKLNLNNWKSYHKNTIELLAVFLDFLADKMSQEGWEVDIDEIDDYRIYDLQETRNIGNLFYSSTDDPNNEMIIVNCIKKDQIKGFLCKYENIEEMVLRILNSIDLKQEYESIFAAKDSVDEKKRKSKIEYIKLFAVLKGDTFHVTPSMGSYQVSMPVKYDDVIEYAQYSEIVDVLNEYNAQDHIVDKYVKIYQVIENFMFKKLLCDLCGEKNYERLTLRDFKAISERLNSSEKSVLSGFIKSAFTVVVDGKSFEDRLKDSWTNCFVTNSNIGMAEKYIRVLSITSNGTLKDVRGIENNSDRLISVFGDMVYATRCSIVHNKVNEYHITYMNLDDDIKWVMEHFLIPNLMDLSYGLMLNRNNVVMYQKDCLSLY